MPFALDQIDTELATLDRELLRRSIRSVNTPCGPEIQIQGRSLLAFCSNDYLGLANHPELIAALSEGAARFGTGSGASHLISGHHVIHDELEAKLASTQAGAIPNVRALFFSTGYLANISAITALSLIGKDKTSIYSAALNHASLIDGIRLARGRGSVNLHVFDHHHLAALENILRNDSAPHKLIVTDGVFSIDGDLAPVQELLRLANQYDALLMIDDAHGFGVLGKHGYGLLEDQTICSDRIIYIGTLGKAAGLNGAFVCAHEKIIAWLIQKARPYIYSTASSPALAFAVLRSISLMEGEKGQELRALLQQNIALWKKESTFTRWKRLESDTAIQPIMVGSNETALQLARALDQFGYWIPAIRPPTVPKGKARLRMTLSAAHTKEQIEGLCNVLSELESSLPPS
ncbi:MAG: 8-amino-7-oxononanoate synthase [Burkholderiaceae bacterium]|nr:8-amino-7-oxononanoate synthase [Burkholderiaceae bacterium]